MADDGHHFTIAGIPVRVEPVFFVIALLFGFQYAEISVSLVFVWMAVMFVSILVHELGHALVLKAFGQPSRIVLVAFGGVTISTRRLSRARSVIVSLSGSIVALLFLWLPARTLNSSDWILHQDLWVQNGVLFFAFANLWWSVANLLPIRPLDGGNVTAELLGVTMSRRVSLVVAAGAAVWALTHGQQYAAFFAGFLAFGSYQEIVAERAAPQAPPPT
jgi:stage IV sporulation protein FB